MSNLHEAITKIVNVNVLLGPIVAGMFVWGDSYLSLHDLGAAIGQWAPLEN